MASVFESYFDDDLAHSDADDVNATDDEDDDVDIGAGIFTVFSSVHCTDVLNHRL
jgi:hypothetical protein